MERSRLLQVLEVREPAPGCEQQEGVPCSWSEMGERQKKAERAADQAGKHEWVEAGD